MKIDDLANELYTKVLKDYYFQKDYKRRAFGLILDEHLRRFNDEAKKIIEIQIYTMLKKDFNISNIKPFMIESLLLSQLLYKNSRNVSISALNAINEHIKRNSSINTIRKAIYDGYNYNKNDIIPLQKVLPKYLMHENKIQAMKLKTKPLKAAYLQLLDSKNENAFKQNMKQTLEEKSRFYAQRIAQTEEARSFNLANSKEILEDNEIKFVKYEMSHKHSITDICDYYANLDVGYGKGIVLKEQMITLPLHPFCYCKYEPFYGKVKEKSIKNPPKNTLEKFTTYEQSKILGSKEKLEEFTKGRSVESIFNSIRPKYPIELVLDRIPTITELA